MISARSGASRSYSLVALLAPGLLGRVSAELSRTVSFSDFATREMQLKRDQRERAEKLVSTSVYARGVSDL